MKGEQYGKISQSIRTLYIHIIEFCIDYLETIPVRKEDDYEPHSKEIKSEVFPNFLILKEKTKYKADEKGSKQEKNVGDDLCSKLFPENSKLTPGLFIVTCCCPKKKVYGYKKMVKGESPRIIFDIIMTRFPENAQQKSKDISYRIR